jgi:hypothetical protein
MVRRLPAVLHHRIMPFIDWWQMVFHHPCRSPSSFVKLRGRELRRGGRDGPAPSSAPSSLAAFFWPSQAAVGMEVAATYLRWGASTGGAA